MAVIIDTDRYLDRIKRSKAPGTYREYCKSVDKFRVFCDGKELTVKLAEDFALYLGDVGLSGNTINRHMAVVRKMFKDYGQAVFAVVPTIIRKLPTWLEADELKEFLTVSLDVSNTMHGKKHVFPAMVILTECGLRANELVKLTVANVQPRSDGGTLVVQRKRNKETSVPMTGRSFAVLWNWLLTLYPDPLKAGRQDGTLRVFPSYTYPLLYEDVKLVADLAGFEKHIHPHALRHTCGTRLAADGMSVDDIAEILGDSIEIARVYVHVASDRLIKRMPSVLGDSDTRRLGQEEMAELP